MNAKAWIAAFRLRTLPLAIASIAMGAFIAGAERIFNGYVFALSVLTTILLQILSNLANDYGDTINGADHAGRLGPQRMVQKGHISPATMQKAIVTFVGLSLVSGVTLLYLSFGADWQALGFFFVLGILAILGAIAYTAGKKPYGYMGLGDLSVLFFFGIVGVMGSYYLHTHTIRHSLMLPALSCGLFSTAVLNINNIRDITSDKTAGKYSVPVRIGRENAVIYHVLLLLIGLISAVVYTLLHYGSPWQWGFLLITPLLVINVRAVILYKDPTKLDPFLKQMAMTTLLFVLLFGVGLLV